MISLMFHDVYNDKFSVSGFSDPPAIKYKIDVQIFESFVSMIVSKHNPDKVCFTFDDGGSSFYNVIAPILVKYNLKGYFFITTSLIGTDGFLTSENIFSLHQQGHIIGSHSHTHPYEISFLNESDLIFEWKESKRILESIIGNSIDIASIPGGSISFKQLQVLNDIGYKDVFTSVPFPSSISWRNLRVIGRYVITIESTISDLRSILNSLPYKSLVFTRFLFLYILKRLLGNKYKEIRTKLLSK